MLYSSDHNKIKFIAGSAFIGLNKLSWVMFHANECIDEDYKGNDQILNMPHAIADNCSQCKADINEYVLEKKKANALSKSLSEKIVEVKYQMASMSNSLKEKDAEINELKAVHGYKMTEISDLMEAVQEKESLIRERDDKIRRLEKKIEILTNEGDR